MRLMARQGALLSGVGMLPDVPRKTTSIDKPLPEQAQGGRLKTPLEG